MVKKLCSITIAIKTIWLQIRFTWSPNVKNCHNVNEMEEALYKYKQKGPRPKFRQVSELAGTTETQSCWHFWKYVILFANSVGFCNNALDFKLVEQLDIPSGIFDFLKINIKVARSWNEANQHGAVQQVFIAVRNSNYCTKPILEFQI